MTDIAEQGSKFIRDLGDAASRNPLSAALIGMGVLWLFTGGRSGVRSAGNALAGASESMQNGAATALDRATRFGREKTETFSDYAKSMPDSGVEMIENARANLGDLFRAQPLALGALGLAVGAGLAAALPATKAEADLLGEASAAVREKAQAHVGKVAENVFNAAEEEARNQGLTLDDAKSATRDVTAKVKRVVEAAAKGGSERTGSKADGSA